MEKQQAEEEKKKKKATAENDKVVDAQHQAAIQRVEHAIQHATKQMSESQETINSTSTRLQQAQKRIAGVRQAERTANEKLTAARGTSSEMAVEKVAINAQAAREELEKSSASLSTQHDKAKALLSAGAKKKKEQEIELARLHKLQKKREVERAKRAAVKRPQAKPGCFITKSCCPREGVECTEKSTPQTGRDEYGEKYRQSSESQEGCLKRAEEVYKYCQSALQVKATYGMGDGSATRSYPKDCEEFPCDELPPLPDIGVLGNADTDEATDEADEITADEPGA